MTRTGISNRRSAISAPLCCAVMVAICSTSLVQAADPHGARPPVIREPASTSHAYNWTGLYAGVTAGFAWNRDHLTEYATATGAPTGLLYDFKADGGNAGVKIGANHQMGMLVAGFEADLERSWAQGGFLDAPIGSGRDGIQWQASIRGRAGLAMDRVFVYGTGGFSIAQIENSYTFLATGTNEVVTKFRPGWTIGAGVDVALTDKLIFGVDYRHTDFGKFRNISTIAFPGLTGEHAIRQDAVRASLSYKF